MESINNVSEYMCPQSEAEFKEVIDSVVSNRFFMFFSSSVWGNMPLNKTRELMKAVNNVDEFQLKVMYPFILNFLSASSDGFTFSGTEYLDKEKGYLFVSNHRDIVVDPLLLQYVLMWHKMRTTDITIGNNLLNVSFLVDLARLNKIFRVVRDSKSIKEYMTNSMLLSKFLRSDVTDNRSVWIAQRNGRAKDGNDFTDRGLVKMFDMSAVGDDYVKSYAELNIVPVSLSYEFESCDFLKAVELYKIRDGKPYVKSRHEDMKSILTGLMQPKGLIHLSFGKPLDYAQLSELPHDTKNDFQKNLTALIDRRIYDGYRLYPNNFIAHDLRSGNDTFSANYSERECLAFQKRLCTLKNMSEGLDSETLKAIFLDIYANPVDNIG